MARAAHFQCEIVLHNVLASIAGRKTLQNYKPKMSFEGSIKLTLGKVNALVTPQFLRKRN